MRFKIKCNNCEELFFSENREALFCPTCEQQRRKEKAVNKKKAVKTEIKKKTKVQQIAVAKRIISEAEKKLVVDSYRRYVEQMERPAQGRRRAIAEMMGLPKKEVVRIIRDWNKSISNADVLNRQARFIIEKKYIELMDKGISLNDMPSEIVDNTPYSNWQAARCLDSIHEVPKSLRLVEFPEQEKRQKIVEIYRDILKGDAHPEPPLHDYISRIVDVTPKQVYKVLVDYRLSRRKTLT